MGDEPKRPFTPADYKRQRQRLIDSARKANAARNAGRPTPESRETPPAINVTVNVPAALAPTVQITNQPPAVTVEAPVTVQVPEQPPPAINVTVERGGERKVYFRDADGQVRGSAEIQ